MVVVVSLILSLGVVGGFTLVTGGLSAGVEPRVHLGMLFAVLCLIDAAVLLFWRAPKGRSSGLVLAFVLFGLGLAEGGYDHIFKDVLYGHHLPAETLSGILPPFLGAPGPWWTEAGGWLTFALAAAGFVALRALRVRKDEE